MKHDKNHQGKNKQSPDSKVRIDKWLWAARFYKTRQLAVKAVKTGKITVNKNSCKPATSVSVGDVLTIKSGFHELELNILEVSDTRGPAKVAQTLYSETENSKATRERISKEMAAQPRINFDTRKPDKRGVRDNRALKRGD